MTTLVKCPNAACATPCSVTDALRGRPLRCPRCGHTFFVAAPPAPPAAVGDLPPSAVGRYQIRGRLGAGAFGTVYRAFDPQLDREVALKMLKAETLGSPRAVERFQREAKAAARMLHGNIVPVFD